MGRLLDTKVLFFSRSFFNKFFGEIESDNFSDIHAVLTVEEKEYLLSRGKVVVGCFEEEYKDLPSADIGFEYLKFSLVSDRFLNRFPVQKRKEILQKEVAFWSRILDEWRPVCVVNETVAIEISEVLAIEAEKRKTKVLTSLCSVIPGYFYWKDNPYNGRVRPLGTLAPSPEVIEKSEEYYNNVRYKNLKPLYVQNLPALKGPSLKELFSILNHDIRQWLSAKKVSDNHPFIYEDNYSDIRSFEKLKIYFGRLFNRYNVLSDVSEGYSYLFYPLHYEPEATLLYFSEQYQNQLHNIEMICRCLRFDQFLVVKEHPQQPGMLLRADFAALRKRHKNLIFLNSSFSTQKVLIGSEAIVTLTSTSGWEGLISGKPVLLLGTIFYDQCSEVTIIKSYVELKNVIRSKSYIHPEESKVKDFIARYFMILEKGYPSPSYVGDFKENARNFEMAINKQLIGDV